MAGYKEMYLFFIQGHEEKRVRHGNLRFYRAKITTEAAKTRAKGRSKEAAF